MSKSLSARLLVLTILFVMLAEVLIFVPSVARFRQNYLSDMLGDAHIAVLALDATPDGMVSSELEERLLDLTNAYTIAIRRTDSKSVLMRDMPPEIDETIDLRNETPFDMMGNALKALWSDGTKTVRVVGTSPKDPNIDIDVTAPEGPLCKAILSFAGRIAILSLGISLFTALLVFAALRWQLLRPMKRLTEAMVLFRENPEDASRVLAPTGRQDEIGVAERELIDMQRTIRETLSQREHLAALGTAVAKINHDLRGILSTALVVSDRLENSADPEVRRVTPTLVKAIDRAVNLCSEILDYVGRNEPCTNLEPVSLHPLISEIASGLPETAKLEIRVPQNFCVLGDRNQLFRAFSNLVRNAVEAGAPTVAIERKNGDGDTGKLAEIEIRDDGPGLPPRAQANLFKPFEGSARAGGTGLGLAIARELARHQGGDLYLHETGSRGTAFRMRLNVAPCDESSREKH